MIRRNILFLNQPFLLRPAGKDYLWGGKRLKEDFEKDISLDILAETWECSVHPEGPSIVASGKYAGEPLSSVLKKHPEYLGKNIGISGELPILIKLIDAEQKLSVQVHPNDDYARVYEDGAKGKTEMWYVVDAAKDAELIYGLRWDTDKETLLKSIREGSMEKHLQKVKIHKDDVFFIEAGTIHAIGAGALIAEIQQNSNITYRLYDYERVDRYGKKRKLEVEKALDAACLKKSKEPLQPMRVLKYTKGSARELLCRCPYFLVERVLINTEQCREMVSYSTTGESFEVLLCLSGCGILFCEKETLCFYKGDCIFVPANSISIRIHGKAQLLKVRV